jgi:hypothetical protein
MSPAQREARDLCALLSISPRTRRWRAADRVEDADTHHLLLTAIEALIEGDLPCELTGPCRAYRDYIEHGDSVLSQHVRGLRPWRLAELLADMADGGVTDAETGAQWLTDVLRPELDRCER